MRRAGAASVASVAVALSIGGGVAGSAALLAGGCRYDYGALAGRPETGSGGTGSGGEPAGPVGSGGGSGGADTQGSGGSGSGGEPAGAGGAATGGAGSGGADTGATGGAGAGGTGAGGADTGDDPDLVLWYRFDDGQGMTVRDSSRSDGGPHDGVLATAGTGGSAGFSTTRKAGTHAVALTSNTSAGGGYVVAAPPATLAPNAVTIALWVNVTQAQTWQRLFDFGNNTTTYMFLTTQRGNQTGTTNHVRFAITTAGGSMEQRIDTTTVLAPGNWFHLAVVLPAGSPYTGTIYVNGVAAGSNPTMTLHPSDLGVTSNNWLGRSQYPADPYLAGQLDDVRMYRRALATAEIAALTAAGAAAVEEP
jgi:hypothetical protein